MQMPNVQPQQSDSLEMYPFSLHAAQNSTIVLLGISKDSLYEIHNQQSEQSKYHTFNFDTFQASYIS